MISEKRLRELEAESIRKMSMEYSRMVNIHPAELLNLIKEIQAFRQHGNMLPESSVAV